MKRSTLFNCALLLTLGIQIHSFAQTFNWAKRAGSYAYDYGRGVCTDGANNVYVTGEFENTAYFNHITVTGKGNHDIFVAKYNAYGNVQWVRRAGGTAGDVGHAISTDVNGNVYVTGEFQVTADFGHIVLNGGYLNDIFIAKYDQWGNIQWAKKAGGNESDKGLGVADKYGNVYVTGFFQGAATFGSTTLYSSGEKDVFLAKYNTYGNLLWAKKFGSSGKDEGRSVTIDNSGNVIVAGYFHNTIRFGNYYLTSNGDHDGFVTKFDVNGNVVWARKVAGPYYEVARGVTNDNFGNIYVTGVFCYGAKFENIALNPYGQGDIFIASYTSAGYLRWVKRAGSSIYDEGTAIKAEGNGNVYLTGRFSGSSVFGTTVLNAADGSDVFIASLNSSGGFRWAVKAGGYADQSYSYGEPESGLAITVDASRGVITTGAYRSDITFGSSYLSPYYNTDIFVSRITQSSSSAIIAGIRIKEVNDDLVTLTTDEHQSFNYRWMKNGEIINEASGSELNVSESGYYSALIINEDDTAMSHQLYIDPAQIMEASGIRSSKESALTSYPNPTQGTVYVSLPVYTDGEEQKVDIINMTGQLVKSQTITTTGGRLKIEIHEDVPDGVYMIRIDRSEGQFNARVVLNRNTR